MSQSIVEEVRRVLSIESKSIDDLSKTLNESSYIEAVQLIIKCEGKIIVTGMGKSGQIARKIASTFSSTGTPSLYLHPAESSHGDLGVIAGNDLVIALSNSGEAAEMDALLGYLARKNIPLIGITGNLESTLAKSSQVALSSFVKEEACPLGLAPTSSSTASLAIGDALAMAVLKEKGFKKEDYAEFHPGGKLGRQLLLRVKDLMHQGDAVPLVKKTESLGEVIAKMTSSEVRGVVGVIDESNNLVGTIVDGDIRRQLNKAQLSLDEKAEAIMAENPKTIDGNELAGKALFLMEQFKIDRLFVIDSSSNQPLSAVGLIHIQDLLSARLR